MSARPPSVSATIREMKDLRDRLDLVMYVPASLAHYLKSGSSLDNVRTMIRQSLSRPDLDLTCPRASPRCREVESPEAFKTASGIMLLIDESTMTALQNHASPLREALAATAAVVVAVPILGPDTRPNVFDPMSRALKESVKDKNRLTIVTPVLVKPESRWSSNIDEPDDFTSLWAAADMLWHKLDQSQGESIMRFDDIKSFTHEFKTNWDELTNPKYEIVPIVGAGVSMGCIINRQNGPSWSNLLSQLNTDPKVSQLITNKKYLAAAEEIRKNLGESILLRQLQKIFPSHGTQTSIELSLTAESIVKLAQQGKLRLIITLNYDHVLEMACEHFGFKPKNYGQPSTQAMMQNLLEQPADHVNIVHIHGDVHYEYNYLVFTESQYDEKFGIGQADFKSNTGHLNKIDFKRPLPDNLARLAQQQNVIPLFVGCSLDNDHVLATLYQARTIHRLANHQRPVAILPASLNSEDREERRRSLRELECNCIFYPEGQHEAVGLILSELQQARAAPSRSVGG